VVREAFTHVRANYPVTTIVDVENNTTLGGTYASSRLSYCGVSAVPVKKVDVQWSSLGGGGTWQTHYDWIVSNMNTDLPVTAVLTLDATLSGGNYRMWMVFTEDNPSDADNAPHYYARNGKAGTNSDMLVTISSPGQQQTFTWTFKWRNTWNQSYNHYGVAFLEQDFGSKTVVQAKQITMTEGLKGLTSVEPASLGQVRSLYH
jgi:hypothetical protein